MIHKLVIYGFDGIFDDVPSAVQSIEGSWPDVEQEINRAALRFGAISIEAVGQTIAGTTNACDDTGACETCGQPIEKRHGIWQHTVSRLTGCRGKDGYPIEGHAYPADWRERIAAWREREFHKQGECGDDCSGCCNEAEWES